MCKAEFLMVFSIRCYQQPCLINNNHNVYSPTSNRNSTRLTCKSHKDLPQGNRISTISKEQGKIIPGAHCFIKIITNEAISNTQQQRKNFSRLKSINFKPTQTITGVLNLFTKRIDVKNQPTIGKQCTFMHYLL